MIALTISETIQQFLDYFKRSEDKLLPLTNVLAHMVASAADPTLINDTAFCQECFQALQACNLTVQNSSLAIPLPAADTALILNNRNGGNVFLQHVDNSGNLAVPNIPLFSLTADGLAKPRVNGDSVKNLFGASVNVTDYLKTLCDQVDVKLSCDEICIAAVSELLSDTPSLASFQANVQSRLNGVQGTALTFYNQVSALWHLGPTAIVSYIHDFFKTLQTVNASKDHGFVFSTPSWMPKSFDTTVISGVWSTIADIGLAISAAVGNVIGLAVSAIAKTMSTVRRVVTNVINSGPKASITGDYTNQNLSIPAFQFKVYHEMAYYNELLSLCKLTGCAKVQIPGAEGWVWIDGEYVDDNDSKILCVELCPSLRFNPVKGGYNNFSTRCPFAIWGVTYLFSGTLNQFNADIRVPNKSNTSASRQQIWNAYTDGCDLIAVPYVDAIINENLIRRFYAAVGWILCVLWNGRTLYGRHTGTESWSEHCELLRLIQIVYDCCKPELTYTGEIVGSPYNAFFEYFGSASFFEDASVKINWDGLNQYRRFYAYCSGDEFSSSSWITNNGYWTIDEEGSASYKLVDARDSLLNWAVKAGYSIEVRGDNLVTPPNTTYKAWIWDVALTGATVAIAAAAAIATVVATVNAAAQVRAILQGRTEQAWSAFTSNPTAANYKTYRGRAAIQNSIGQLFGCSKVNKQCYWSNTSSQSIVDSIADAASVRDEANVDSDNAILNTLQSLRRDVTGPNE